MKKLFFITLMWFQAITLCFAEDVKTPDVDYEPFIRAAAAPYINKHKIPGLVIEGFADGKPYSYYYGYANRQKKTPVSKETIFEIGSISKVVTNLMLAQEIDLAHANLTDSIKNYLNPVGNNFKAITLKDLATHTAGLPFKLPKTIRTQKDLSQFLQRGGLGRDPGSTWMYSNVGIGLIGAILERINDHSLQELAEARIVKPLALQRFSIALTPEILQNLAQGYDKNGRPVQPEGLGLLPAAYGFKASAEDMQTFLSAAIGLPGTTDKIFYPMRLTQTAFVSLPNRLEGLGWNIHRFKDYSIYSLRNGNETTQLGPMRVKEIFASPTFDGDALIDKTGATSGFKSYIAVIPNKKSGLVILANKYIPEADLVKLGREILFKTSQLE